MAEVRVDHVTKSYAERVPVIRDLSLHVRDHEFLVLVGPSGCGKSTVLRMIAGLEDITDGTIFIGDRPVNDVAPKDRDIAMVFQNYALYPHMSVRDNMAFALRLRRVPNGEADQRVRHAGQVLGISEAFQRKPRALSGGQRQRVALGRALVREPHVYLLDEPLSNLDAKLRVQTRTEISRLHQATGTTFVYVTHDQVEAMTMGDRIAVLNAGVLQQLGTPQEVYDAPANLFVAGFIGSPAMNFFQAQLVRGDEGAEVAIGDGARRITLRLYGRKADAVARSATASARPVVVGIRPEDMRLANEGQPDTLSGIAEVVEHLGNEQLLYLHMPGQWAHEQGASRTSIARIPPHAQVRIGETISLAVNTARLHIFDSMTTARVA